MKRHLLFPVIVVWAVSAVVSGAGAGEPEEARKGPRFEKWGGPPPGLKVIDTKKEEFGLLEKTIAAKREKITSLRKALSLEENEAARERIRADLKEALGDIRIARMRLAEMKRDIAKKLMMHALDRYVQAERELARLEEQPKLFRRFRGLRREMRGNPGKEKSNNQYPMTNDQ